MTVEIPLTKGYVALVDEQDAARVLAAGPWFARPDRQTQLVYATHHAGRGRDGRRTESLHTFVTGWPFVDHRNGNALDNRRANLREATRSQNSANRRVPRTNKCGLKGVRFEAKRWRADIKVGGTSRYLGRFDTAEDAARAYDVAAREAWGEFAALNFPLPEETAARCLVAS